MYFKVSSVRGSFLTESLGCCAVIVSEGWRGGAPRSVGVAYVGREMHTPSHLAGRHWAGTGLTASAAPGL